ADMVFARGYIGAQQYWYSAWSGRFTFTAVVSALELIGAGTVQVLPAVAVAAAVAAGTWALLPVARHSGWPHPWLVTLALAELVVFAVTVSAPYVGQSLLWQTGLLTYVLPLILFAVYAGLVLRRALSWSPSTSSWVLACCAGLLCLAGGLSETTLAVQMAGLLFALLISLATTRGERRRALTAMLVAGIVGSLLATVFVGLAPGTKGRVLSGG